MTLEWMNLAERIVGSKWFGCWRVGPQKASDGFPIPEATSMRAICKRQEVLIKK